VTITTLPHMSRVATLVWPTLPIKVRETSQKKMHFGISKSSITASSVDITKHCARKENETPTRPDI
jgi:hypothetical protein